MTVMPYLTPEGREFVDGGNVPRTAGELNYALCTLAMDYWSCNGLSYQTINDVIGALESAKAELYRKVVQVYEDRKADANGDVFEEFGAAHQL